jgi:hypothetical protein
MHGHIAAQNGKSGGYVPETQRQCQCEAKGSLRSARVTLNDSVTGRLCTRQHAMLQSESSTIQETF